MKKVLQKKLQATRRKVSKLWVTYRKEKTKILKNKRLTGSEKSAWLAEKRSDTYNKISLNYQDYREKKHSVLYHSPYEGFMYTKQFKTEASVQKIYKARRNFDTDKLENIIPKILDESNVKGVLIVFKITFKETGESQFISNYINYDLYDRLQENEQDIYDYVTERFSIGYKDEYELKFIYLRIIYAKSQSIKSKN